MQCPYRTIVTESSTYEYINERFGGYKNEIMHSGPLETWQCAVPRSAIFLGNTV
jgi:hypothetical protein